MHMREMTKRYFQITFVQTRICKKTTFSQQKIKSNLDFHRLRRVYRKTEFRICFISCPAQAQNGVEERENGDRGNARFSRC